MNKLLALQSQAITAAKKQQWENAVSINQQIVEQKPDIGAYNRLGVALLQLDKKADAKKAFEAVLGLDKSNSIAKKHLKKLSKNEAVKAPNFQRQQFIEEPGKTKTVSLHRLAGKNVLDATSVGQECSLKPKSRFVSVESEGQYLGAVPEDLSVRLVKLIKTGNEYRAWVSSVTDSSCSIFIKEISRSPENANTNSFSNTVSKDITMLTDINESLLMEENIPVEVVETDNDSEDTPEDVHTTTAR